MPDTKLTDFTELAVAPAVDDWLYLVKNAGASGDERKIKVGTLTGQVKIAETLLGSAAASISFSSIPATFRHLLIVLAGRTDRASVTRDTVLLRVNSDSGANYDRQDLAAQNTTVTGSQSLAATSADVGTLAAANATAGRSGVLRLLIADYAGTTFWKSFVSESAAMDGGGNLIPRGGQWKSTAAIDTVAFTTAGAANFLTGTLASLYGIS